MTQWVKRDYSKGEIDRAGALLIPWWIAPAGSAGPENLGDLYMIVENWRTSHGLPLNVFNAGLRQRAKRVEPNVNVIVAQRLKRFSSVMRKLVREPKMKLSQMQDLGGCRAILTNVAAVDRLYEIYHESNSLFESEEKVKCDDYIRNPKDDGYRGIHVVGRYSAKKEYRESWNGHRIEIQLRSRLQHAFATAVETVTTFTRTPLKFGGGPEEWRRFFSLMGSAFALAEGTELVENTPRDRSELIRELQEITKELKVRQRLVGWTKALQQLPRQNVTEFKWLLLMLDLSKNTIKVTGYADRKEAERDVAEIEQLKRADLDAVLVWVRSIKELREAYPNYYADTGEFLLALKEVLHPSR